MRLLLTRPVFEAERTAAALRQRGHEVTFAPMLEIETISDVIDRRRPLVGDFDDRAAMPRAPSRSIRSATRLASLRCFAVGAQTAAAARACGL